MVNLTLVREGHRLASPEYQRKLLESSNELPRFQETLTSLGTHALTASGIETLQVNVGRVCNQTCSHCHVDAGPDRKENMSAEVAEACLEFLSRANVNTLDITGGAPEMNPSFRRLVTQAHKLGRKVIDRCNLTILQAPGYEDLAEFLAEHQVEVVASLPCYLEENVNKQRGDRVFQRSIAALKKLNTLGYGVPDSGLSLSLVYNPLGPSLPPDQQRLEADYRRELRTRYGIEFTQLFTITNMPISRFLAELLQQEQYETYMQTMIEAFNPATIEGLMCRTMLSVDWLGNLYDCDFNQMLDLELLSGRLNIMNLDDESLLKLLNRKIVTGRHCFGCTAGCGSSCQGSLAHTDESSK
ncbi:arsenosugar biosynthesis radical SAM (seleno)protein ArsS [Rubinisphaera italica]|uniref:Cyclic pyranopterin monophosphate synthase n=1 Tax=Rubinisphaera italica TaxID=2527969 RepID=A0A5C5XNS5_9PLAN|nr:arsenosugar biosynthesis radical SAM (seleno)protein ArsS [Rubinisphaera italica]TWT64033.1 Cyclic pyranopterin monophosphate synthase [Rubinisphaera italica]